MDYSKLKLQPLRIPMGWHMEYNNALYEIDISLDIPAEESWWIFKEDMLQIVHPERNRMIDIGFYPEGDMKNGAFGMVMHEGDFSGKEIAKLSTRDRHELLATLETWMQKVTEAEM